MHVRMNYECRSCMFIKSSPKLYTLVGSELKSFGLFGSVDRAEMHSIRGEIGSELSQACCTGMRTAHLRNPDLSCGVLDLTCGVWDDLAGSERLHYTASWMKACGDGDSDICGWPLRYRGLALRETPNPRVKAVRAQSLGFKAFVTKQEHTQNDTLNK